MRPKTKVKENEEKKAMGITSITIEGYKSLAEESAIAIRPLTILAGANSSGKSSAIQPLLLLKQTLECPYDPGPLLLDGPNCQISSFEQILSNCSNGNICKHFTVHISKDDFQTLTLTYQKGEEKKIEIAETKYIDKNGKLLFHPEMNNKVLISILQKFPQFKKIKSESECKLHRSRCFLTVLLFSKFDSSLDEYIPGAVFITEIKNIIHVPGIRGNPVRIYGTAAFFTNVFIGRFEHYTAGIIHQWQSMKDARLKELFQIIELLGLTWKVEANQLNDTQIELKVGRLPHRKKGGTNDLVNIADVGFGVSQVLPVLVALLVAEPGQLVYIEQPELHLHPNAQVALAQVLADAAKRGVRVVAETHSSLLLLAIQLLVAKGYISKDEVILHWFKRREDGVSEVTSAELDEAGAYGDWPEDFCDVALKLDNRYISAAESRHRGQAIEKKKT
ncbi:MAG: DUF3696 domain-containing protein [Candidatus Omnitrophota bacterium]|nr:MAG: DUF3696 domain-containing protein [Candidatus Omnitrophota bacterium]